MRLVFSALSLCTSIAAASVLSYAAEVSGYYEPQYMTVHLPTGYYQLFTNKLRVDLGYGASGSFQFRANFDFITYHGRTEWNVLEYIPESIASAVPPQDITDFDYSYGDSIFLDNAYLTIESPRVDLTIGRQQISVGSGFAWNPTDLFNFKTLIDPTYEQPGHNAVRLDLALPNPYSLTLIFLPEENWDLSGKLISLKSRLGHFDYALLYVERLWRLFGYPRQLSVEGKRKLYGGHFAGELLGLGLWGEWGYNTLAPLEDFWEILWGADYTLDAGTYLMAEYYHNGLAKTDYRQYSLNDWMRFFFAQSRSVCQDNLLLYLDYPWSDLLHLRNSVTVSLSDLSLAFVPSINYSLFEDVEVDIFLNFYSGRSGKAYSTGLGSGGIVRLRAYF